MFNSPYAALKRAFAVAGIFFSLFVIFGFDISELSPLEFQYLVTMLMVSSQFKNEIAFFTTQAIPIDIYYLSDKIIIADGLMGIRFDNVWYFLNQTENSIFGTKIAVRIFYWILALHLLAIIYFIFPFNYHDDDSTTTKKEPYF